MDGRPTSQQPTVHVHTTARRNLTHKHTPAESDPNISSLEPSTLFNMMYGTVTYYQTSSWVVMTTDLVSSMLENLVIALTRPASPGTTSITFTRIIASTHVASPPLPASPRFQSCRVACHWRRLHHVRYINPPHTYIVELLT